MIALDVRTVFLIVGLLYVILPTLTWIVLSKQHSRQVALWCVSGLMTGGAMISISAFRGSLHWAIQPLLALIFSASHVMRIQSLRLDLGRPWRTQTMVLAFAVYILVFESLESALHNAVPRALRICVDVVLFAHLAGLAWHIGSKEDSRSARWIAGVYGLLAAAGMVRVLVLLAALDELIAPSKGISVQLLALSFVLVAVVGHFGYVGMALDRSVRRELKSATDRARDEESRRLGQQIAHLDRLRGVGELSTSLGHELNQPLAAILTNVQVAKRGLQAGRFDTNQVTEFLDRIAENTRRASQIIERIRGFIRPSPARKEPVDLQLVAREVGELVADEARSHKVSLVFPDDARQILVTGDSVQLSQIVLNVFRNAIEALRETARREIQVSCASVEGRAILRIRDTGPGLTPDELAQAGAPFFTTKLTGLGVGLSISRTIAAQHGGTLTLANADASDGGGVIVELNLPALPVPQE